ncbi:hypothetical protein OUZ56_019199 [Daphnia magna]|uniref:Uncharacterized protein n=1 Tax=Daphnia magna TaxID=35525 RepID=A0ABQ9ZAY0_9CRUS|nr:hypothetical protein OUZ56_019199 [Daphnia magna]
MRRGDLSSSMFCSLFVHDPNARPMSVSNAFKKKEKTLFRREIRATAVPALRPPRQEQETTSQSSRYAPDIHIINDHLQSPKSKLLIYPCRSRKKKNV